MPLWLMYMLAGIGCLTLIGAICITIKNYFEGRNERESIRVQSLKRTMYGLEQDVCRAMNQQKEGNDIMLDLVKEIKKVVVDIDNLKRWKVTVNNWIANGKEPKEKGPDGP